jgi:hypothetical protein
VTLSSTTRLAGPLTVVAGTRLRDVSGQRLAAPLHESWTA